MSEKQVEMWDVLAAQDGETVLRLLTNWHGLRILDEGLIGYLKSTGYIKTDNCTAGTYDCESCQLRNKCPLQDAMEAAITADSFDDFCDQFQKCRGCPMSEMGYHPCKEEHWIKWKLGNAK